MDMPGAKQPSLNYASLPTLASTQASQATISTRDSCTLPISSFYTFVPSFPPDYSQPQQQTTSTASAARDLVYVEEIEHLNDTIRLRDQELVQCKQEFARCKLLLRDSHTELQELVGHIFNGTFSFRQTSA